jgi:phosphoglycerate dehydrogenase-like enzyme
MAANRKRVLLPQNMARAGWDLIRTRDDVEAISYPPTLAASDFHRFLAEAHGIALSYTPYHAPELAASPVIEVVARIGVGYDSVGVAAGCEPVSDLDAALPRADFLTIHCPKTAETAGMIDARRLALLRPTAFLVNTARGGIVDEAALAAALTEKRLAGAGIDVFATEPVREDNPLLKLSSVIVSPHMAGVTSESTARMAVAAVGNILSVFDGKPNRENVVNEEVLD